MKADFRWPVMGLAEKMGGARFAMPEGGSGR
jgi:hypothetical protein